MALAQALVKAPPEFAFGDDFALFYERFNAFAKCDPSSIFSLSLSYLDDTSFKKVETLVFGDDHKTDSYVNLTKQETYK